MLSAECVTADVELSTTVECLCVHQGRSLHRRQPTSAQPRTPPESRTDGNPRARNPAPFRNRRQTATHQRAPDPSGIFFHHRHVRPRRTRPQKDSGGVRGTRGPEFIVEKIPEGRGATFVTIWSVVWIPIRENLALSSSTTAGPTGLK